ncbi:hypothetical protein Tco_1501195 [Tanacetum coccineum]
MSSTRTPASKAWWGPGCSQQQQMNSPNLHTRSWEFVVSSSLFRGGVSASGISALRLVDGAGRGIEVVIVGKLVRMGGNGGSYHGELSNLVPARTTVGQPQRKDPQMEYSKIVPQSEQTYR